MIEKVISELTLDEIIDIRRTILTQLDILITLEEKTKDELERDKTEKEKLLKTYNNIENELHIVNRHLWELNGDYEYKEIDYKNLIVKSNELKQKKYSNLYDYNNKKISKTITDSERESCKTEYEQQEKILDNGINELKKYLGDYN